MKFKYLIFLLSFFLLGCSLKNIQFMESKNFNNKFSIKDIYINKEGFLSFIIVNNTNNVYGLPLIENYCNTKLNIISMKDTLIQPCIKIKADCSKMNFIDTLYSNSSINVKYNINFSNYFCNVKKGVYKIHVNYKPNFIFENNIKYQNIETIKLQSIIEIK